MLSGQSTDRIMHVLEGAAAPCCQLAVYLSLTNDHPLENYHHSAEFVERMACWPIMCIRSVPARERSIIGSESYRGR